MGAPRITAAPSGRGSLVDLGAFTLLGLAAGLPYAVFAGTIFAYLTDRGVEVATIGVLSWIGLLYGFKFLWSPLVDAWSPRLFGARKGGSGRRRAWVLACQGVILLAMVGAITVEPAQGLGLFAAFVLLGVFASATQDIAIDAWRIESAADAAAVDRQAAAYQLGYRSASFLAGAGALVLADAAGWVPAFFALAAITLIAAIGGAAMPADRGVEAMAPESGARRRPERRRLTLGACLTIAGWAVSIILLARFMATTLTAEEPPSARRFILETGPWIVFACVVGPGLIAAFLAQGPSETKAGPPDPIARLYDLTLAPLVELTGRLRWGALSAVLLVLSYRFADAVWGSFAYPFYLGIEHGALGHSLSEVAFASKTFGALMTLAGVPLAGLVMAWVGRHPALIAGAVLAALTNLLFADLAAGAPVVDAAMRATGLGEAFAHFGVEAKLARLIVVIAMENVSGGFATAAYVAYLSGLVSRDHAATQYALLFSMTLMIGALGRGALGDYIESDGFAAAFVLTALCGGVAVLAALIESARAWRARRRAI